MQQRISFVTLGVADVAAARGFYERLGWKASASSNENVTFFNAGGPTGGLVFALFGRQALAEDACVADTPPGFSGVALAHNVAAKEDVAKTLAEAEAAGARILKPAQDVFWGGHCGYFADLDGHLWEVAWNPCMPLDENGAPRLPD
jgi:uncharacterized protein